MFKKIVFWLLSVVCIIPYTAYAGKKKCDAGTYMPANSEECNSCPKGYSVYCPGDKYEKNFSETQGIKLCGETLVKDDPNQRPQKVSQDMKKCETAIKSEIITCKAGQFLPAGKSECINCAEMILNSYGALQEYEVEKAVREFKNAVDNKKFKTGTASKLYKYAIQLSKDHVYCPGGNFVKTSKLPSGLYYCKDGPSASFDRCGVQTSTATSGTKVHCDVGFYGKRGTNKCDQKCSYGYSGSQGAYCPGGDFFADANADWGVKKCDGGIVPSSTMTECKQCSNGAKNGTECNGLTTKYENYKTIVVENTEIDKQAKKMLESQTWDCTQSGYFIMDYDSFFSLLDKTVRESKPIKDLTPCKYEYSGGYDTSAYYVTGAKAKVQDKEQGRSRCPEGQISAKSDPKTCYANPANQYTCKLGYYLPANETSCESCTSAKARQWAKERYCEGGTFSKKNEIQGVKDCTGGQIANEDRTGCIKPDVCPAGQVWVNGACQLCTSQVMWINYAQENRMYCPGVTDSSLPILKQLKKCPKGAWPNASLTDCDCKYGLTMQNNTCVGTVSSDNLYYGPNGKDIPLFKQCWTKVSEKAYKKCMGFDN